MAAILFAMPIVQAAPLDPPAPEAVAEARRIVQEMADSERGPYSQIAWFCNDGTILPPVAYACREHGGGRQHAQYSAEQRRLAELGWNVGTVFAALSFDQLFVSAPRQQRLRELALERYMADIDNGWVLRRAQSYRGRVQVEDEDYAGSALLQQLLEDTAWAEENFLLLRESARVIPHGEDTDLARVVRRTAIELAALEPAAERWRVEIHTSPSATTAGRLRGWLASQQRPEVLTVGEQLAADLDLLYGSHGRRERLEQTLDALRRSPSGDAWRSEVKATLALSAAQMLPALCSQLSSARAALFAALPASRRLSLMDAMQALEIEVQLAYQQLGTLQTLPRLQLLQLSQALLDCAYGSGLLSAGERRSLLDALDFADRDAISLLEYRKAVAQLKRAPAWALGTIRHTFAEAMLSYIALDERAARFGDDVLRGSPLWMLGDTLRILSLDVDRLAGSVVAIAGHAVSTAVALNSGVATGRLRIFATNDELAAANIERTDIVVLPETSAELPPVAGILTLGEGNALSHVQLLARNFGIPNVAVDLATIDLLLPLVGEQVVLVVGSGGNVLLQRYDETAAQAMQQPGNAVLTEQRIEVAVPDLAAQQLLHLKDLGREQSGKLVGPKAANLGELNRLFPGKVAPAIAIPFGVYAAHLQQAGLMQRIEAAFAGRDAGRMSADEVATELAAVRSAIAAIQLSPATVAALDAAMAIEFGEPGSYGLFVRSDTNVEDLPQFTGAGLNETIANVVGVERQLAAVPRVWSSVLSPRALAWRATVLANPAQIYASVLLMQSVSSTKSGVLVTSNLFDRRTPGLTASVAWGVGGAVAGEAAESLVILADGTELVSEAKSPYQRSLAVGGGVELLPAKAGVVLQPAEIQQLRELAAEVNLRYASVLDATGTPRPWDIEFGFVDGALTLFQIRPLVEKTAGSAEALLARLRPGLVVPPDDLSVQLGEPPAMPAP